MVIVSIRANAFLVKITLFWPFLADLIQSFVLIHRQIRSNFQQVPSLCDLSLQLLGKWNTALSGSGTHSLNRDHFPTCQAPKFQRIRQDNPPFVFRLNLK